LVPGAAVVSLGFLLEQAQADQRCHQLANAQ
jgi:hypothetical protein